MPASITQRDGLLQYEQPVQLTTDNAYKSKICFSPNLIRTEATGNRPTTEKNGAINLKIFRLVRWLVLLTALGLLACDSSLTLNNTWFSKSTKNTVERLFAKAVSNEFTGVILVRHRGEVLLREAAGFANRELEIPNSVNTVFSMGSITKQYTSALMMALQEKGLLTVKDRLADHFNGLPEDKKNITIHQLLTHTAGFRHNFGGDTIAISRDTFLKLAWATRLENEPGTQYRYSNAGYSIASAIAEIVTGLSYEVALKKFILDPANLKETGYLLPGWSNHTLAIGYKENSTPDEVSSSWADDGPYWNVRGNGGLLTTADDLLKWFDVLAGESVLSAGSINAMQGSHVDTALGSDKTDQEGNRFYGYGWITQDEPKVGLVRWHTGGNRYFFAFVGRAVEKDLIIIGLSNESNGALDELVEDIGDAVTKGK